MSPHAGSAEVAEVGGRPSSSRRIHDKGFSPIEQGEDAIFLRFPPSKGAAGASRASCPGLPRASPAITSRPPPVSIHGLVRRRARREGLSSRTRFGTSCRRAGRGPESEASRRKRVHDDRSSRARRSTSPRRAIRSLPSSSEEGGAAHGLKALPVLVVSGGGSGPAGASWARGHVGRCYCGIFPIRTHSPPP
jgi:hypothetical protein